MWNNKEVFVFSNHSIPEDLYITFSVLFPVAGTCLRTKYGKTPLLFIDETEKGKNKKMRHSGES